ncbi:MAG: magnesium-protoporphyrin IX monomethyl ester (oxidative) cyclase, partial [Pseudomonadota bacterium]
GPWPAPCRRLPFAAADMAQAKGLRKIGAQIRAGLAFVSLLTIPAKSHTVPASTRLEPVY